MYFFRVFFEILSGGKVFITFFTGMWTKVLMNYHYMRVQLTSSNECLVALITCKRFLSSMCNHMSYNFSRCGKIFTTFFACMRSNSLMHEFFMETQSRRMRKCPTALLTCKGTFSCKIKLNGKSTILLQNLLLI